MKKMHKGTDVQYVPDCNVALFRANGYAVEGELPLQNTTSMGTGGENNGQENGDANTNGDHNCPGNDDGADNCGENGDSEPDKLVCPFCGKKYASQATLDRHIKEKHSQE